MPSTIGIVASGFYFSPLELSPELWLDASALSSITHSSGSVSQWDDLSGNGRHVAQSTAANQPTTGTRTQNGLNVLDFDGTNDSLISSAAASTWSFLHNGTDYVIAAVISRDIAGVGGHVLATATTATGIGLLLRFLDTNNISHIVNNNNPPPSTVISNNVSAGTGTTARVLTLVANPTAATQAGKSGIAFEGASLGRNNIGTQTVDTTNAPGSSLTIGNRQTNPGPLNGIIAEIVIVSGANATEANRVKLRDYLNTKWAVY